jgi:hypothetical protein
MKTGISLAGIVAFVFAQLSVSAQPGGALPGMSSGSQFSPAFSKLFGEHKAFSADSIMEVNQNAESGTMTMPGKVAYSNGKSRMELDLGRSQGPQLPAGMADQLKGMGMGEVTIISDEGTNISYFVYPGLKAYAALAAQEDKPPDPDKLKMETSALGNETVDGHPCVKNKVTMTDANGRKTETLVWNATDLKKFPVRIEAGEKGAKMRLTFKNIKFEKPDTKLFEPPANFTKHTSIQGLMGEAMKKMLGGAQSGQQ